MFFDTVRKFNIQQDISYIITKGATELSYILDPPILLLLGMFGYYLWKRLRGVVSDGWREIVSTLYGAFFCFGAFMMGSAALYLDLWDWPIPYTEGPVWMFHTDITGIAKADVAVWIAVVMLFLYPVWYLLGYRAARAFDEGFYRLEKVSYEDVKSRRTITKSEVVVKRWEPPQTLDKAEVHRLTEAEIHGLVEAALQGLGGLDKFVEAGQRVLIKPNISGGNPTIPGSFTSIEVVDKLVDMIRTLGAEPVVADSDMIWTKFYPVAQEEGWLEWAEEKDVVLLNLAETDWVRFDFGKNSAIGKVPVSKELVEADVIISVPTMKTHLLTNITIAMKNMYGTFPQENKAKYHRFGIEDVIYEVNDAFTPNLTIIDGTIGGEAWGPLSCRPVDFHTIIASNDVVAADSVACQLMGYDPDDVLHVKRAHERNLGEIVEYDMTQLFPHEKDKNWVKPEPLATYFYEGLCELVLLIPGMQIFFDLAADVVLYDFATLPGFRELTPIQLGVLNDVIGGLLRGGVQLSDYGQARMQELTNKVEEYMEKNTGERRRKITERKTRMFTQRDEWPSENLANAVQQLRDEFERRHDSINPETSNRVLKFDDPGITNPSVPEQLEEFAPDVNLIGFGLRNEKTPTLTRILGERSKSLRPWKHEYWGGVLSRAIEKAGNKSSRCLQYLYVYTRQRGTVSFFWMVMLPWLMFLWTFYLKYLFTIEGLTSSQLIQFYAFFLSPLPVFLMSLRIHIEDIFRNAKGQKIVFRSTTPVIFLYPIMAFSWQIELLSWALLAIGGIFWFIWLLEYAGILPTSHAMDYVPVFIWIEKISDKEKGRMRKEDITRFVGTGNWRIKHIVWDIFHYHCQPTPAWKLRSYTRNRRVLLEIPDTWHAMEPEKVTGLTGWFKRWILQIGVIGCLLSASLGVLLRFGWFQPLDQFLMSIGMYELTRSVFLPFIFIVCGVFIVRGRCKLVDSYKEYSMRTAELTESKLRDLWNMDEKPRLKLITKLQYPFTAFELRTKKLQTFQDDTYFLYETLS